METKVRKRNLDSTSSATVTDDKQNVVKLKQEVGVLGGISLVVGTMIGSGIFMSPASILIHAHSVGASLCIWAACGVLATFGAMSYIELGLMIKKSGGEYQYLKAAYGEVAAFLFAWTSIIVTKPSSFAIIAIGFAQYVTAPFYPGCTPPATIQKCAAAFCILIISLINCFSVKLSNFVQIFFTAAKLLIIASIIIGGFVMLGQGHTENLTNGFEGSAKSFSAIAVAFYSGLWSYDGWNQLNFVTEELQNPVRNFPLTIMIGIPMVTVLYILVNIAYFTVMTPSEIISSSAVAITFGDRVFGPASFIVPVAVACSTFGAANGSAFTAGRLTYAAGRNGHMLKLFSYISVTKLTPSPALIFNSFIALLMIIPDASNFSTLIDYFTFASWIFYGATFLSVIVLRFRKPEWKRPYRVFIAIPAICFITSCYLIVAPIIDSPQLAYLYAAIFIIAGLVFYFPLIYFKKVPPFMEPLTSFLQQVLEVVPPPDMEDDDDGDKDQKIEEEAKF
uniref:b(0,+)-type amino acid transporter 1-like n=1 Tax=Ciona intestinalis TaxID=7719 RepID=UPI000180B2BF|nr:b(0,+)-type amino acid transporter 1-like [Ciona intestinalis]|eukprot:XP_002119371.1 b(0,+)-type amino acid transporter 1-like [Ciona intestinalis]